MNRVRVTGILPKQVWVPSCDDCRRVGMADEADSKSVVGNNVRVQVPPPALNFAVLRSFLFIYVMKGGIS